MEEHKKFMEEAYKEAVTGYNEGGVPVGAVMTLNGKIIARFVFYIPAYINHLATNGI